MPENKTEYPIYHQRSAALEHLGLALIQKFRPRTWMPWHSKARFSTEPIVQTLPVRRRVPLL